MLSIRRRAFLCQLFHRRAYCTLRDNVGYYCTIFQTSNVDNGAFVPWVRILETAAPLFEAFSLRVDAHHPGTQHNIVVPVPRNFLTAHRRLCRLNANGAFLQLGCSSRRPTAFLAHVSQHLSSRPSLSTLRTRLDCLCILPCLSAHLCRENPNRTTATAVTRSSSRGPRALSLSVLIDCWTEFILSAWRTFAPPTLTEDRGGCDFANPAM
jgi:hypothetical protein